MTKLHVKGMIMSQGHAAITYALAFLQSNELISLKYNMLLEMCQSYEPHLHSVLIHLSNLWILAKCDLELSSLS